MRRSLYASMLMVFAMAGSASVSAAEPTTNSDASNGFVVPIPVSSEAATAEAVIPRILEAGRDQLAAACEAEPGASIRIFHPLASGSYEDVTCSTILDGSESVGQTSEALTSGGEPVGQVQQRVTPVGLVCSALTIGSALFLTYALCPNATNAHDERYCGYSSNFGMGGMSFLCLFI